MILIEKFKFKNKLIKKTTQIYNEKSQTWLCTLLYWKSDWKAIKYQQKHIIWSGQVIVHHMLFISPNHLMIIFRGHMSSYYHQISIWLSIRNWQQIQVHKLQFHFLNYHILIFLQNTCRKKWNEEYKGTHLWLRYKINHYLFKPFKYTSLTRVNCEINGN